MSNVEGGPHGLEQGTIPAFVSTECVAKKVVAGGWRPIFGGLRYTYF